MGKVQKGKRQSVLVALSRACSVCHMEFFPHIAADGTAHAAHHNEYLQGPRWATTKKPVHECTIGKATVHVYALEKPPVSVARMLDQVNAELGAPHESVEKVYVAVASQRAIGVCTAKALESQCRWMVQRTQELAGPNPRPLVGIARIWVAPTWRRKGVATTLLRVVCKCHVYGMTYAPQDVAFSQPSSAGSHLAASFSGEKQGSDVLVPVYL